MSWSTAHAAARSVSLGGPELLSFRDQVRTLAHLLGREIELRELSRERAAEQMARYLPAPFVEALLNYWSQGPTEPAKVQHSVERITGRSGRTFRRWAEENLAAFS
ncbi:MAG: hypothetical protein ACR2G2_19885 [Pseudonocardia sp.]